jgi:IS5 family transposase
VRASQLRIQCLTTRDITALDREHAFELSDEDVVWQWVENPYWQGFTGETLLQTEPPIDPSSLTCWRKRVG